MEPGGATTSFPDWLLVNRAYGNPLSAAVGHCASDAAMLGRVRLGALYRSKSIAADNADVSINSGGLMLLLFL